MTATEQHVILVDEHDKPIGTAEKMRAHRENLCHRAFSVFILRKKPSLQVLLQQRAFHKYHSAGLWTNTCCSHPFPGEDIIEAGQRRLHEEMGIEAVLSKAGVFHYAAQFENGLFENEMDHVLVGFVPENIHIAPNPEEVHAFRWVDVDTLKKEMEETPEKFTVWVKEALGTLPY